MFGLNRNRITYAECTKSRKVKFVTEVVFHKGGYPHDMAVFNKSDVIGVGTNTQLITLRQFSTDELHVKMF